MIFLKICQKCLQKERLNLISGRLLLTFISFPVGIYLNSCVQKSSKEIQNYVDFYITSIFFHIWTAFSSVTQPCLTLSDPMDCSTSGFPVYHQVPELTQTHVHQVGDPSNHLILCRPLLLPPSILPSIRVFSNEPVLCIRWPKYWSFSLSTSPSNEY